MFSFLQTDHLATAEATSLNHPSDGSEDQEETHDAADQSGEDLLFFLPSLCSMSLNERELHKCLISSEQKYRRL